MKKLKQGNCYPCMGCRSFLTVYKDENEELFVVDITCPHLGCELNFNRAECTWDCPCHASRFSYKGEIISGPAHYSLKSTKNKIDPNLF